MNEPQFATRNRRRTLLAREYPTNNNPVFSGRFLGENKHLISGRRRAYHSPTGTYPGG